MFRLKPRDPTFFEHFDRVAAVAVTTAERFLELLTSPTDLEQQVEDIKTLEHQADDSVHTALAHLHRSFITPLHRGDIRRLLRALDDIVDHIENAAKRIAVYDVGEIRPGARRLARILVEVTREVEQAVKAVRQLKNRDEILKRCIEINRLENEADHAFHEALGRLFSSVSDPLVIVKWKDIFEDIETAIDRCEDVADVVEGIVLENA